MRTLSLLPLLLGIAACGTKAAYQQHCAGTCPVDAKCGADAGTLRAAEPSTSLCATGTASDVSGDGPWTPTWTWTCFGINGGTDAECSAAGPGVGTVTLGASAYRASEGGDGNDFFATVELITMSTHQVTLKIATVDGSAHAGTDYQAIPPTTIALDPGTQWFHIKLTNDGAFEGDRTFQVAISEPGDGGDLGDITTATVTIVDDDPPPQGILELNHAWYDSSSPVKASAYAGRVTVPVSRIGTGTGAVSIHYATIAGGTATAVDDYGPVSGTLTWADGDTADKSFVIPVVRDVINEEHDTIAIAMDAPTGSAYLGIRSNADILIEETFAEHPNAPVLQKSAMAGNFDSDVVDAPSVVQLAPDSFVMFYSALGAGDFRIGRAVSADGITWNKSPATAVTTFDALHPSVLFDGATWRMWYGKWSAEGIYYATSADGLTWTEQNGGSPVLVKSSTSTDFDGTSVFSPSVIRDGVVYVMWYTVMSEHADSLYNWVRSIARATSYDGISWTKGANPVLEFELGDWAVTVSYPSVIKDGATYWMVYAGGGWLLGLAMSTDGVTWAKHPNPLMPTYSGQWDSSGYLNPSVLLDGETMVVWFSGYGSSSIGRASNP